MIGNYLIVDGVVHGYNWTTENWAVPQATITNAAGAGFHKFLTSNDASRLTREEFLRNWRAGELEEILFLEAGVDIAVYHGTPIWDFYKDGHSDTEKGFTLRDRNPNRVIVYGAVNPFEGGSAALDRVRYLVNERGVDGLKVYAARYDNRVTRGQPLDDPDYAYPFIELALDLGVKVIATHKAMPFGPVRAEPYGVGDLATPCSLYPEMNFEIVHSGFAFVEDTAFLCTFPNVWLNLEASFGLLVNAPNRFAQFFGEFLNAGAASKMFFASGCALAHPLPVIQAFLDFQMPSHLVEGYGYPLITDEIKRDVLGLNLLRLHQIDPAERLKNLAGDRWSVRRANEGGGIPYAHFRASEAREKV